MNTTQLTLICHGPTLAQKRGYIADDEPLMESYAPPLHGTGQLLCGPERRTRESAALLGDYHVCQALREVDPGRWRGQALSQLAGTEPEALAQWLAEPAFKGHGGESVIESVARLAGWMDALEPGTYRAVTHPSVIRAALLHALGAEAQRFNRLDIAPWGCVRLSRRGHWRLLLAS